VLPIGAPVAPGAATVPGADTTLRGPRVTLRAVDPPADAPSLFVATSDAATWTYLAYGPFATAGELEAMLALAGAEEGRLALTILGDGRALGTASYMRIVPEHRVIEIGHIVLGSALRRTPAATEAIYLLARHALDELGYRRLEWKCDALNAASRSAAERYGFRFEGVFREHMIVKGRNRDTAWFAILEEEWPSLRGAFEAWLEPANFDADGGQRRALGEMIAERR
jgi:RimJ/RimL family protein N-acetyltransferase